MSYKISYSTAITIEATTTGELLFGVSKSLKKTIQKFKLLPCCENKLPGTYLVQFTLQVAFSYLCPIL